MLASNANAALASSEISEQLLHSPRTLTDELLERSGINLPLEYFDEFRVVVPQSTNSPISSLPVELLSHIFILTDDNSTITQVCQHWKAVAIGTAELWTRIIWDKPPRVELAEKLKRSKTLPLRVTIFLRFSEQKLREGQPKPDYLLRHLGRIESLVVDLSTRPRYAGRGLEYNALNKRCRKPAPKLRYLVLIRSRSIKRTSAKSISRMFPGANLYHLELRRVGIFWDSHLLSQRLTYLHLSDFPFHEKFTRQEIKDVLERMPGLEYLYLECVLRGVGDLTTRRPVHLPCLKKLMLGGWTEELVDFFTLITFPGTLEVLQVHALGRGPDNSPSNAMAWSIQDACTNWREFWSHEVQIMTITASTYTKQATFKGITGGGVEKFLIELPCFGLTPEILDHTSFVLFGSGAHGIKSIAWSCPDEACSRSMQSAFRSCPELEQVTVGWWQLTSLAQCLENPTFDEFIQNLDRIVIERSRMEKVEESLYVYMHIVEKELDTFMKALAWRRKNEKRIPKITLRECVVPARTYLKLIDIVDIVGEVERLE